MKFRVYSPPMGNRLMHQQPLYLQPEKAEALAKLSAQTRIPKAVLLREAVDDLLVKHGAAHAPRKRKAIS